VSKLASGVLSVTVMRCSSEWRLHPLFLYLGKMTTARAACGCVPYECESTENLLASLSELATGQTSGILTGILRLQISVRSLATLVEV
jgi:hypothetical protein